MKLKSEIYNKITIPKKLDDYFKSIEDGYDDPYFVLVKVNENIDDKENTLKESLESQESVYVSDSLKIDEEFLFFTIDCSILALHDVFDNFVAKHREMDKLVYVSVFHHNCLGKPQETFKWGAQLLDEVIDQSSKSSILYNDFSDKKNWPGIEKYMSQED